MCTIKRITLHSKFNNTYLWIDLPLHIVQSPAVIRACFAALRQIRSVRRSLSRHALLTLVRSLIVSKVDYCNSVESVLAGIPGQLQDRLQSVLNAAARLVFSARRSERITQLLRELHWLRVPELVTFRLCVLVYRCLHGTAPAYLAESLHRTSDVNTRRRLHSADSAMLVVPSTRRSTLGDRAFSVASARGTACCRLSGMHRRWQRSVASWRLYFSGRRLTMIRHRDCTAQYNCCLPATIDCWRFCRFVFLFF